MDRERLGRLLEEPAKVAREDLADLKELTERYPWFTTAHLLRAVGEKAAGDVEAGTTLQKAAAHLPSRAVLFDLTDISVEQAAQELRSDRKKEVPSEEKNEVSQKKEVERTTDPIKGNALEPKMRVDPAKKLTESSARSQGTADPIDRASTAIQKEEPIKKEVPELKLKPEDPDRSKEGAVDPIVDQDTPTTSPEGSSEQVIGPERSDPDRKEGPKEHRSEKDALPDQATAELEKQILEAALATAYDLTWKQRIEKPPARVKDPIAERADQEKKSEAEIPQAKTRPIEKPSTARKIDRNTKLKFTDWLSASSSAEKRITSSSSEKATPASPEKRIDTPAPAERPIKPTADPRALIDRFIEHETPAPVRKAEFFTPQQAAKRSLDDTAGLVSETLARIYAEQGNIPKAIEAYERLALKYPEKSAYFAALSKELEKRSNT